MEQEQQEDSSEQSNTVPDARPVKKKKGFKSARIIICRKVHVGPFIYINVIITNNYCLQLCISMLFFGSSFQSLNRI